VKTYGSIFKNLTTMEKKQAKSLVRKNWGATEQCFFLVLPLNTRVCDQLGTLFYVFFFFTHINEKTVIIVFCTFL
jgi:hypothetical protein